MDKGEFLVLFFSFLEKGRDACLICDRLDLLSARTCRVNNGPKIRILSVISPLESQKGKRWSANFLFLILPKC